MKITTQVIKLKYFVMFVIILLLGLSAKATQSFTVQGRLLNADGTPLTSSSVQFKIQVRTTGSENCLLFQETQTLDLSQDQGAFSLTIGQGTRAASSVDGGNSLDQIFSNSQSISLTAAPSACANSATSYTPAASDTRNLVLSYNDGSAWDTVPTISLSWVPQATYAQDAGKLGGTSASQYLSVTGTTPTVMSASDYVNFLALIAGTSTTYVANTALPNCAASEFLTKTSGTYSCAAVSGASGGTVTSVTSANAYLSVATGTTTPALTLNVGTTANTVAAGNDSRITGALQSGATAGGDLSGTYPNPSVAAGAITATKIANGTITDTQISASAAIADSKLATISTAGKVSGAAITSGTIGGTTAISTSGTISSGNITSSGTMTAATVSTTNLASRNAQIFDSGSNKVTLQTPASIAASYSMTLPPALPASNGYVLSSDTSGVLSWIAPLSGDGSALTNLNASNISSGTLAAARLPATAVVNGGNTVSSAMNIGSATGSSQDLNLITGGITQMTVTSGGGVGIGTTNPDALLNVSMNATATLPSNPLFGTAVRVSGADYFASRFIIDGFSGTASMTMRKANGTAASPSALTTGSVLGTVAYSGYGATSYASGARAAIGSYAEENWTDTAQGARISFWTTTSGTSSTTERMRIDNAGNVGIGTTAPQSPLHLATTVPASANKGLACFGPGPFDGATAGFFAGSANGTVIAANAASGYTGSLIDLQVAGSSKFKVDNSGNISSAGTMAGAGNYSTAGNISTTLGGTITSSGNMYATSGSASTSSTTGALVVTGGAGISGALNVGGAINSSSTISASTSMTAPTLYGDSAASGNLTIDSTSNATKGNIYLAPSGGNVGIGAASAPSRLTVSTTAGYDGIRITGPQPVLSLIGSEASGINLGFMESGGSFYFKNNTNTSGTFNIRNSSNADIFSLNFGAPTGTFAIDSSGNVGIGTASPSGKLTVSGGTASSGNGTDISISAQNGQASGNTNGGNILLYAGSANGTGTPGYVKVNSNGIHVNAGSNNGANPPAGFTGMYSTNTDRLDFATGGVIRYSILSTGNVVMGSPSSNVVGNNFVDYSTNQNGFAMDNNGAYIKTQSTKRITVDTTGKVGIGTTSPGSTLMLQDTLTAASDFTSTTATQFQVNDTSTVTSGTQATNFIINKVNPAATSSAAYNGIISNVIVPSSNSQVLSGSLNGLRLSTNNVGTGASGSLTINGIYNQASHSSNQAISSMYGIQTLASNVSTGTISNGYGALNEVYNMSTGTITNAFATYSPVVNFGTISTAYGLNSGIFNLGTITTGYGLYLSNTNIGTMTNAYGIYVGTVGGTNKYAIYTADGSQSYFSGNVGIGPSGSTPAGTLDVQGGTAAASTNGTPIQLYAQNAGSGNQNGGSIILMPGTATGTGVGGIVTVGYTNAEVPTWMGANGLYVKGQIYATGGYIAGNAYKYGSSTVIMYGNSVGSASDYWYLKTNSLERMRMDGSGNLGIGNSAPGYKLDVTGDINSTTSLRIAGTQVCTSAGCTAVSDRRLKENILPLENSLENILKLDAVSYDWKDKSKYGDKHQIGFIAQDVEKIFPEVIATDKKSGLKSVAYDHLVAPIVEAVKALNEKIDEVFGRTEKNSRDVASVKEEMAEVKAENARLKKENESIKAFLCSKDSSAEFCN